MPLRLLLLFAGLEDGLGGWPDGRSLAMQRLAGSHVLGHILNQLSDLPVDEIVLVLEQGEPALSAWCAAQLPGVAVHLQQVGPQRNPWQALASHPDLPGDGPLLLVLGDRIIEALFAEAARTTIYTMSQPQDAFSPVLPATKLPSGSLWAGACFFGSGAELLEALAGRGNSAPTAETVFSSLYQNKPAPAEAMATMALGINSAEGLLYANARLLGLGYGTEDAIERSYVEDFTVIPPVYLHDTAVIENAVVGPFANVEAGARIRDSVVRNSLVGIDAVVENAVLDGSMIGDRAIVHGRATTVTVATDTELSA
jgi:glucose-1-phosphate thymidylyltransferase